MRYTLLTFLWLLIYASIIWTSFSSSEKWEKPFIIPRASWGANAQYNDRNGIYWQQILAKREENEKNATPLNPERLQELRNKNKRVEEYLYGNFIEQFTSKETLRYKDSWNYRYAWPIKYTNTVDSIVIHHTHSEYKDSLTWVRDIHRFHSLSRQWGDIWYNYIIWYDGEIFEGREWWDYAIGAHSKYNNFGSVSIAVIWDYHENGINKNQYQSLESLTQYLIKKYWIDLRNQRYYHRDCKWEKCDTFPIETYLDSVLIGHKDATHTSCPWDELYKQVQKIRSDNLEFSKWRILVQKWSNKKITNNTSTAKIQTLIQAVNEYSPEQRKKLIEIIDIKRKQTQDRERIKKLQIVRLAIILSQK